MRIEEAVGQHNGRERKPEDATREDIIQFLSSGQKADGEPARATWNIRLSALRAFFGYLVKQGRITMNLTTQIERQRVTTREPVPLTFAEMIRLIEAVENHSPSAYKHRNVALLQVFFHCALRVSEVVSLNVAQMDLENYLFLDVRAKGGNLLSVAFNDVVAEALNKYLGDRGKFEPVGEESALFLSDRKRRLSQRSVQEMVRKYSALAIISRPVSPQDVGRRVFNGDRGRALSTPMRLHLSGILVLHGSVVRCLFAGNR